MALNLDGAAQTSLTVFGGLVTESAAVDLPEGVSPDCRDVEFVPGSVFSRRALQRLFAQSIAGNVTLTYGKSYTMPNGDVRNLYLDSSGNLWWNDVTNSGNLQLLCTVNPGTYAKSITAFGREYIAIIDLLHGADVPLQWDGTFLDRVTQDGPAAPPVVANFALPSVSMSATGTAPTLTITEVFPDQEVNGYFTTLNIYTTTSGRSVPIGDLVTIGSGTFEGTYQVISNPGPAGGITVSAYFPSGTAPASGGTLTIGNTGVTMSRQGNIVTVQTAAAHNLLVGYQALISGETASSVIPPLAIGGGISQIVIDNENLPGIAVITTPSPHGLIPQNQVIIDGVTAVQVGGGISAISWNGGVVNVTTTSPHGLSVGALVTLAGTANYNGSVPVASVPSATTFTFILTPLNAPGSESSGTISLNWPIAETGQPIYYEVLSAPSPTTFQVQIEYSDGIWTSGSIGFPWQGTFFVMATPNATTFTYQQYGPNGTSSTVGQVTPYGQVAPGLKQCQVSFLTRQGYLTKPSPPVQINCNGGQYLSITNLPIGPPNVVARVIEFTGAGGSYFFYIPAPPQINAQVVATATQINDNVTTAVVLDFSDNTLFSALGISIPGNTPVNQIVIDGALGFGYYADRLVTWGQRNRVQNLLNMGFEGGAYPSAATQPLGWNISGTVALAPGHVTGLGCGITALSGVLTQSLYEDAYGAPIAQPNTQYLFRAWVKTPAGLNPPKIIVTMTSASTGFISTAVLPGTVIGQFLEVPFSAETPTVIPADLVINIAGNTEPGQIVTVDEMSLIYAQTPYTDTIMNMSYVDNPEAFDGLTGVIGASQDTHKIMELGAIRETLYFLTQDPGGRLHQTSDNGVTEPSGWTVAQVAAECGLLSALGLTKSQADDSSAAGGEEWFAWASSSGARIFGGDQPWKISQEIQPDWDSISNATASVGTYSALPAYLTCWALNDPDGRCLYFGLPIRVVGSEITNPNRVYAMSYRELETAYQIGTSGPIHTSFTGKLIATDHTRKWTPWNMTINLGALMSLSPNPNDGGLYTPSLQMVFMGGNGAPPGTLAGFGQAYTLNAAKFTDDDYGQIFPSYTTYFFVSHDQELQLSYQLPNGQRVPLGAGRKLLQYLTAFIGAPAAQTSTSSLVNLAFLCNSLTNQWPLTVQRTLSPNPTIDLECGGGSAIGNRIAVKISSAPANPGTGPKQSYDNGFNLQHLSLWMKAAMHLPIRGAAQ